jgi:protein TonB
VLPAERPPVAPPRKPIKRQPEPEPVYERPQTRELDEDQEASGEGKGKSKMLIIAGVAAVALIGGGVGFWKMNSKPATPAQPVATQTSTTAATSPSATQLTPTTTPAGSVSQPTPVATDTPQETPTGLGRQSTDAMKNSLNAPSRLKNDLQALGASNQAAPTQGFSAAGMDNMGSNPVFTGSGPKVKVEAAKRVSISAGIAVGLLVQKTPPVYPAIAKSAHISGTVVIQATISKSGSIENSRVVSGPTMLRQSALDAVKTWRFRPYLLDGQPVEVETTVNVVFNLGA